MAIIVTYDLANKHRELKQSLFQKGYTETIKHTDSNGVFRTIYLPNTTLHHSSKTASEAVADVQNAAKLVGTELERCISTIWDNWHALYGKPFGT